MENQKINWSDREQFLQYHRDYGRKWYQEHKKEHDIKSKLWSQNPENKKKQVQYVQKYVQRNKEKVAKYNQEFSKTFAGRYRTTKCNAKKRGYIFQLSLEEYGEIISRPCIYCGESQKIGIDRIDNSIGYTKENSASCCFMCNYMKKNYSKEEFLSHIEKIYLFQNKLGNNPC